MTGVALLEYRIAGLIYSELIKFAPVNEISPDLLRILGEVSKLIKVLINDIKVDLHVPGRRETLFPRVRLNIFLDSIDLTYPETFLVSLIVFLVDVQLAVLVNKRALEREHLIPRHCQSVLLDGVALVAWLLGE